MTAGVTSSAEDALKGLGLKSWNERFTGSRDVLGNYGLGQLASLMKRMHSCLVELVLVESQWKRSASGAVDQLSITQLRLGRTWCRRGRERKKRQSCAFAQH